MLKPFAVGLKSKTGASILHVVPALLSKNCHYLIDIGGADKKPRLIAGLGTAVLSVQPRLGYSSKIDIGLESFLGQNLGGRVCSDDRLRVGAFVLLFGAEDKAAVQSDSWRTISISLLQAYPNCGVLANLNDLCSEYAEACIAIPRPPYLQFA